MFRSKAINLDLLGMTPELKIFGKKRFQTLFGSVMTIISSSSILALSLYFIISFYLRKDLSILSQTVKSGLDISYDISGKPFMFKLFNLVDGKVIDPKLASIVPYKYDDLNNGEKAKVTKMDTIHCSNTSWDRDYDDAVLQNDITDFSCLDFKQTNLLNITYTDKRTSIALFTVQYCKNTTENGNSCFPPDYIKKNLTSLTLYFKMIMPDFYINHDDFSQPVKKTVYKHSMKIDPTSTFTLFRYYLKAFEYLSDQGVIFEQLLNWNEFGPDPSTFTIANTPAGGSPFVVPEAVSAFTLWVSLNTEDKIKRNYPKLQSLIASIGGVLSAITFIARSIVTYISKQMAYAEISVLINNINQDQSQTRMQRIGSAPRNPESTETRFDLIKVGNYLISSKNSKRSTESLSLIDAILPASCTKSEIKKTLTSYSQIIDGCLSIDVLLQNILSNKSADPNEALSSKRISTLLNFNSNEKTTSKLTKLKESKKTE